MSIEEDLETEVYMALNKVYNIPRKSARETIFKNIISTMMQAMGWDVIQLDKEKPNDKQG